MKDTLEAVGGAAEGDTEDDVAAHLKKDLTAAKNDIHLSEQIASWIKMTSRLAGLVLKRDVHSLSAIGQLRAK